MAFALELEPCGATAELGNTVVREETGFVEFHARDSRAFCYVDFFIDAEAVALPLLGVGIILGW